MNGLTLFLLAALIMVPLIVRQCRIDRRRRWMP